MHLELLRLRRRHHASLLFLMPPFPPTTAVWNEAYDKVTQHSCRNTMTQPTQISIQLLFLSFLTLRDSRMLHRRTDGLRQCVGCAFQVCSVQRRRQSCLCCILSYRLGTSCKSFLWLAFCRSTPTDTTPVLVAALSKTPLRRSVQPLVFPRVVHHAFASWLQSLIRTRTECSLPPLKPLQASEDHVPALGGRVLLFSFSLCLHRRPSVVVGFGPQLQSDSQATSLSHSVCTSAAPGNQKQIAHLSRLLLHLELLVVCV